MSAQIRALGVADARVYMQLRRRALELEPHSFSSSPEEDISLTLEGAEERLGPERVATGSLTFGAFAPDLVGLTTVHREPRRKLQHKAWIFGVFVVPEIRRRGVGRALMERAISHAKSLNGLDCLLLGVSSTTVPALTMYGRLGFERIGVEPRAQKVGDTYSDEILMRLPLRG